MVTVGDRVVSAYGDAPVPITVRGVPMVGQYGTIIKVNNDGWHHVRLDGGIELLLDESRYELV